MNEKQPNPYLGIHYTGIATNRYLATFGPAPSDPAIGNYATLAEAITARKIAIAETRKGRNG